MKNRPSRQRVRPKPFTVKFKDLDWSRLNLKAYQKEWIANYYKNWTIGYMVGSTFMEMPEKVMVDRLKSAGKAAK